MPDEIVNGGAQPAGIDMDALGRMFDTKLQEGMGQVVQSVRSMLPRPAAAAPVSDPVGDMVRPVVEPVLNHAMTIAQSAADQASFYSEFGQELDGEDRKEIEKTFSTMLQNGRPMARSDVWKWIQGNNIDKVVGKKIEQKEKKQKEAEMAQDSGAGVGNRQGGGQATDPYSLNQEQLDAAMKGVSF